MALFSTIKYLKLNEHSQLYKINLGYLFKNYNLVLKVEEIYSNKL